MSLEKIPRKLREKIEDDAVKHVPISTISDASDKPLTTIVKTCNLRSRNNCLNN